MGSATKWSAMKKKIFKESMVENLPSLVKYLKITDSRNIAYHKKDN